ncbi:MAG TPA: hypothetical protein VGU20_20860 [Stellaceae bacterium]|nr:hypothetical protein [Stellaceae bacterium]
MSKADMLIAAIGLGGVALVIVGILSNSTTWHDEKRRLGGQK